MAVRFILGRAGAGKTRHCLEAIRGRLAQDPIDGPRLLLLVPEQASLQMERAIVQGAPQGVVHRAEVLSFQRLAYRVLETVGAPARQALSEPARAMVLRHLLHENRDRLQYYRRVSRLTGFLERLDATITEFIQEAIDPAELTAFPRVTESGVDAQPLSDGCGSEWSGRSADGEPVLVAGEGGATQDPAQRAKLHDLQLIYAAYLAYLGDTRLDPSQYLQTARAHLARCAWLHGSALWVDGFASLTRQELLTLVALAGLCPLVEATVLTDPRLADGSVLSAATLASGRLFAKTTRAYEDLHRLVVQAGIEVEDPLFLRPRAAPRFARCPALACLETRLFQVPEDAGDADAGPGVELVELPSRRLEVEYAVSRLCAWVQGPRGYRYRDLALIVRDLEPYHDLLAAALDRRHIPYFIDRRRPTAHHPLIELLRSVVALAADDMLLPAVRLALKTGLLPLTDEQADELENYLLAYGIHGRAAWRGPEWSFVPHHRFGDRLREPGPQELAQRQRVNTARRQLLDCLEGWFAVATRDEAPTGTVWHAALLALLERLGVPDALHAWAATAEADGNLDEAEQHRQVWRDTLAFLDDLAFAFADTALAVDELAGVLESGLATFTLGLAPPMLDEVLVGSIERSRHPDIRAAVVLGFTDGLFPPLPVEDAVLNDEDRDRLLEAGVAVRPPARQRVLDEALLAYIALTRASEALVVTYPTADNSGKALRPSPYVAALTAGCPGLTVCRVEDPVQSRALWDIWVPADVTRRLACEFRQRPPCRHDQAAARARFNAMYEAERLADAGSDTLRDVFAGFRSVEPATLTPAALFRLGLASPRFSVSQLETYAACPFKYFAQYLLGLKERAEAALAALDVGRVHHAILEDFVASLGERRARFTELADDELKQVLSASWERVAARLTQEDTLSNARDAYVLRRSRSSLARVLRAQQAVLGAGRARPHAVEVPFGFDGDAGLPALELTTPKGRRIQLRGYLDRVDLAEFTDELLGVVVDYKHTREKRLELSQVYHGLSLQLLTYALVLAEHGHTLTGRPLRPIAALYLTIAPAYELVEHPEAARTPTGAGPGTTRPRGLINAADFRALDAAAGASRSAWYAFQRKLDGTLANVDRSDGAEADAFRGALRHTRRMLGVLADGLLDGDVAVRPYRLAGQSPCGWCPFESVCGVETGVSDVRILDGYKRSDLLARFSAAEKDRA